MAITTSHTGPACLRPRGDAGRPEPCARRAVRRSYRQLRGRRRRPHRLARGVSGYLLGDTAALLDPAPALNALTVGSLARHERNERWPDDPGYRPVARTDQPSPFTRHGPSVNRAIKPDLVDYGGNLIVNVRAGGRPAAGRQGVGELSTSRDFAAGAAILGGLGDELCGAAGGQRGCESSVRTSGRECRSLPCVAGGARPDAGSVRGLVRRRRGESAGGDRLRVGGPVGALPIVGGLRHAVGGGIHREPSPPLLRSSGSRSLLGGWKANA